MKIQSVLLVLPVVGLVSSNALGQSHTERGAVLGGVGGALAGAAIGKHNGETAAGALIGGAVGLLAGSALGSAKDQDVQRQQAMYHYQMQAQAQAMSRAVSPQDLATLTHSGVDPQIIITQIRQNGVTQRLEVADVIALHQQGVDPAVITAFQNGRPATVVVAPPPAPVVVQEHHYYAPRPHYRTYHYYPGHYHRHHHRHGPSFYGGVVIYD